MLGLVFAALMLGYFSIYGAMPIEQAFIASTGFMYQWYWLWFGINLLFAGVLFGTMILGSLGMGVVVGSSRGGGGAGARIAIIGSALFGGVGALSVAFSFLRHGLFIGGAWCLMTAGTPSQTFAEFDQTRLIVGGVMLMVGIIWRLMSRGNSSSSSSSSNDN